MKCAENKSRLCRLRFAGNGRFSWLLVCFCLVSAGTAAGCAQSRLLPLAASEPDVASRKRIEQLNTEARAEAALRLEKFPQPAEGQPGTVALWSARGDADMFLGNFVAAEAAYRKMVELDPELDASHWRLGIACFFADHAKAGRRPV